MNGKHCVGLRMCRLLFLFVLILTVWARVGSAQIAPPFTTLHSFSPSAGGSDGATPWAGLIQGKDGDFYGTTSRGGTNNAGTVFKTTASGTLTTLYSFSYAGLGYGGTNSDGAFPSTALVQGANANFYGVAGYGGSNGTGTVFMVTTKSALTVLYTFSALDSNGDNADGAGPSTSLVQGKGGMFYGATYSGGANGTGTVFKMTTAGALTVLYTFSALDSNGDNADGAAPIGIMQGADGNLYGTTFSGGAHGFGSVFKMTTAGVLTTLYSFSAITSGTYGTNSDGAHPVAALIQGGGGALYGTTTQGGANGYGTFFKITTEGSLTSLHSFTYTDGGFPYASLVQGKDGALYSTTSWGGVYGSGLGTVFKVTTDGALTSLYSFSDPGNEILGPNSDGMHPYSYLLHGKDGNFYGTASAGGVDSNGTVFKLTMIPVITSLSPTSGTVGTSITIKGANFTEATAVRFGTLPATFTINSDTSLTLTAPSPGAASATITVVNPFGKATSSRTFVMAPVITSFSPAKGKVGASVNLTGVNFTGATAAAVGAVAASFKVNSDKSLTLTVPTGAVTGKISVVNSFGTGTSSKVFTVTP